MDGFLSPQQYFRLRGARPRKQFGQHFLARPETAERIVDSADLKDSDVAVEVGPGLGALTRFIAPRVRRLHLVELDRDLADYLKTCLEPSKNRVFVHQQDVLGFDFNACSRQEGQRLVVLGNLPYNISSPLVFRLLESAAAVNRAVFMVQKEVGERLTADPGSKTYGVLSVLLGVYARTSRLFSVGPGQFYPSPKVDSIVIKVELPEGLPPDAPPFSSLRRLVNIAFQQRRKTLQNSLKPLAGKNADLLQNALALSGIDPKRRPETLSPQEFIRLANALQTTS